MTFAAAAVDVDAAAESVIAVSFRCCPPPPPPPPRLSVRLRFLRDPARVPRRLAPRRVEDALDVADCMSAAVSGAVHVSAPDVAPLSLRAASVSSSRQLLSTAATAAAAASDSSWMLLKPSWLLSEPAESTSLMPPSSPRPDEVGAEGEHCAAEMAGEADDRGRPLILPYCAAAGTSRSLTSGEERLTLLSRNALLL